MFVRGVGEMNEAVNARFKQLENRIAVLEGLVVSLIQKPGEDRDPPKLGEPLLATPKKEPPKTWIA